MPDSRPLETPALSRIAGPRWVRNVWLFALLPFAFFVDRFHFVCDDAFITFRYARNLAEGLGLRYNLGVEPPVEGYTDLGWVLWMALVQLAGIADVALAAKATTILCGALLLRSIVLSTAQLGAGLLATSAAALFFATLPHVGAWSTGGLGTMAFAFFIFATSVTLLRGNGRAFGTQAGLLAIAVATLRADGAWWLFCLGLIAVLLRREPKERRQIIRYGLISISTLAVLVAVRLLVHGDWVPNTARAKVAFSALTLERGLLYLCSFWIVLPAGLLLPIAMIFRRGSVPRDPLIAGSILMVLATYLYGVLVGGDFMAWSRFFLPALPFLAVLVGVLTQRFVTLGVAPALLIATLLIGSSIPPAFGVHLFSESVRKDFHFRWGLGYTPELTFWKGMKTRAERWILLGKALGYHTRPDESIVMGTIGAAGFYSRLFIYDRRGLVTPAVNATPVSRDKRTTPGHDRQVPVTFFSKLNPTYIEASLLASTAPTPTAGPLRKITRLELPEEEGFPPNRSLLLTRLAGNPSD